VVDAQSQIPCFLVTILTIPPSLIDVNLESDKSQVLIQHHDLIIEKIKAEMDVIYPKITREEEQYDILSASAQSIVPSSVLEEDIFEEEITLQVDPEEMGDVTFQDSPEVIAGSQRSMNTFATANLAFPRAGTPFLVDRLDPGWSAGVGVGQGGVGVFNPLAFTKREQDETLDASTNSKKQKTVGHEGFLFIDYWIYGTTSQSRPLQ
jgi:DNA mismatch repair ATPase MutL